MFNLRFIIFAITFSTKNRLNSIENLQSKYFVGRDFLKDEEFDKKSQLKRTPLKFKVNMRSMFQ